MEIVLGLVGIFLIIGLGAWSVHSIRYDIRPPYLRITWLGLPVRRFRLDDIHHISIRPIRWAEKWHNTWFPGNRLLVVRRNSGLLKHFSITPKSHFVFKAELERAREALVGPPKPPEGSLEPAESEGDRAGGKLEISE